MARSKTRRPLSALPVSGLYAITDRSLCEPISIERSVELALRGGASVIQYRDKGGDGARRRREAEALCKTCRAYAVPLIINDDVSLARAVGADGVHIGRDDESLAAARAALGPEAIIGVSCYNRGARALAAQQAGADYVAFGRFFGSSTKPDAIQATPELIRAYRSRIRLPIVAIGGITPENGAELIDAGVDFLAAIGAVFGAGDPEAAARRFAALFAPATSPERPQ